jgi:hypothetical protein
MAMQPRTQPITWQAHPTENPFNLPYFVNNGPEGTDENAAPKRKAPTVKGAITLLTPTSLADNGPIVVSRVDVVRVNAQHNAK